MPSTIFVYYDMRKPKWWEYKTMPRGWWWVGKGISEDPPGEYTKEEEFKGPSNSKTKMISYLQTFFKDLEKQGTVKRFKICGWKCKYVGCIKQKTKKYRTRNSPPYSAMDCKNTTMLGNDWTQYTSVADKNGIYRWQKTKKNSWF